MVDLESNNKTHHSQCYCILFCYTQWTTWFHFCHYKCHEVFGGLRWCVAIQKYRASISDELRTQPLTSLFGWKRVWWISLGPVVHIGKYFSCYHTCVMFSYSLIVYRNLLAEPETLIYVARAINMALTTRWQVIMYLVTMQACGRTMVTLWGLIYNLCSNNSWLLYKYYIVCKVTSMTKHFQLCWYVSTGQWVILVMFPKWWSMLTHPCTVNLLIESTIQSV